MHARLILGSLALASGVASADVTLTTVDEASGKTRVTVAVAGGKVRVDSYDGEHGYLLWRTGEERLLAVSPARKRYLTLDKATLDAGAAQMKQAMADMQERMKNLPPELRDKMMKAMPQAAAAAAPSIEYKVTPTGRSETKGGRRCELVELTVIGLPLPLGGNETLCVVAPDSLGIPAADLRTLEALAEFTAEMTRELGRRVGGVPDLGALGGYPVWSQDRASGTATLLKEVKTTAVPAASFVLPADYKEDKPAAPRG